MNGLNNQTNVGVTSEPETADQVAKQYAPFAGALLSRLDRADAECPFKDESMRATFIAGWLAAHVDVHERGAT